MGLLQFISGMSSCSPQPKATAWVCCTVYARTAHAQACSDTRHAQACSCVLVCARAHLRCPSPVRDVTRCPPLVRDVHLRCPLPEIVISGLRVRVSNEGTGRLPARSCECVGG